MKSLLNSPFAEKSFVVGGFVRDTLMGLTPDDADYVVEATVEEFEAHFNLKTVGERFPIYIIESNEVALTRQEASTGSGYHDFELTAVGVDIEEDLARRDFTINSMAMKITNRRLIDPFNGGEHIKEKKLVTVFKKAFSEDPVRILRGFRFAAKFGFEIEAETLELMKVSVPDLGAITKERIVKELEKAYKQFTTGDQLVRYFELMLETGALEVLFPPVAKLAKVTAGPHEHHHGKTAFEHTMDAVRRAKDAEEKFHIFMAVLFHDVGKGETPEDVLPHHYEHERRSAEIAEAFLADHRFSAHVNNFVPVAARLHMRFRILDKLSPRKLARLAYETRLDTLKDLVRVAGHDHPFSVEDAKIVTKLLMLKSFKVDATRVKSAGDKRAEVLGQMTSYYKSLKK
jgi:tRNA nucleotidyltransferase (CCA-adding enzyme)